MKGARGENFSPLFIMKKNCKTCGNKFDSCMSCLNKEFYYWKRDFCSIECFQKYIDKVENSRKTLDK